MHTMYMPSSDGGCRRSWINLGWVVKSQSPVGQRKDQNNVSPPSMIGPFRMETEIHFE